MNIRDIKGMISRFSLKHNTIPDDWIQFGKVVRTNGCCLLKRLDEFENSVLIIGCQRSGTTMLARIITNSEGMVNYWFGRDDELDAALILSGWVPHKPKGRYCFQTTYLNECYHEYFEKKNHHKIIWVLRNPFSVIKSMMNNWQSFALNELFDACGTAHMSKREKKLYARLGKLGISKIDRACLSYNGKVSQLFELKKNLKHDTIRVVEYDDLVNNKEMLLPMIYEYINLPFLSAYSDSINSKSISKADMLSKKIHARIDERCMPVYKKAASLVDISA